MKPHYSEADLLETYYTQPGESMPVMMHLADCEECAARYERLERKLRTMTTAECEKPETFWARQRISVMRTIERPGSSRWPVTRVAAAAVVALVAGGIVTVSRVERTAPAARVETASTASVAGSAATVQGADTTTAGDPWQSDQLKEFQSIVAWESWVENGSSAGGQSL